MVTKLFAIAVILVSVLGCMQDVTAQTSKVPALPKGKYKNQPEPRRVSDKEISIPGFPRFPGSKFVNGSKKDKDNGVVYNITYSVAKSQESQVAPFFAGALGGSGLSITQRGDDFINATNDKSGIRCSIFVNSYDQVNSDIVISYSQITPGAVPSPPGK